jgi:hypothetical protein
LAGFTIAVRLAVEVLGIRSPLLLAFISSIELASGALVPTPTFCALPVAMKNKEIKIVNTFFIIESFMYIKKYMFMTKTLCPNNANI